MKVIARFLYLTLLMVVLAPGAARGQGFVGGSIGSVFGTPLDDCGAIATCGNRRASVGFTVGALGNIFACHAVDNPDLGAELLMLAQYGPRVDPSVLRRLALAFDELRRLNTEGVLAYPYSMRELVHLVTHLNTFPHEVRMLGPRGAGQFVTGTCACVACARVRDCE